MPGCHCSRVSLASVGLLLSLTSVCQAQPLVAPTEALSPAEQQKLFHLPPGFEIQLVAAEPEIAKPMNITFDSQGRLWVTDTLEYPYPAKGDAVPRDCVKILVDRDGDGRAEQISTFVDKLNIPLGVMPIPGGVICYGIPQVMRCMDTDHDGKADIREPLYLNFGSRDTHGMVNSFTRGLDGWLYACHGFNNDSAPEGADGQKISMNSGNTFRMKPDGSRVEYFTHGQVNPFGLAFDPLGNLYSADCHTLPCYNLLRGAYYPSFGKAHDGLDFGPTMINHNHGSTGIGGIAYYSASQFPAEYRDTILIGNPVTGRVNHDKLEKHGSSYNCIELPDFISCDDLWFRPVNLQVGPDGALYIADFYNCIIGHYEVPLEHPRRDRTRGRIWRVVYTGKGVDGQAKTGPEKTAPAVTPNIHGASLDELLVLLGHDNLTVRTFATHELVDRIGPPAIESLKQLIASDQASADVKVHGLWALERLAPIEPALLEKLLHDPDRLVRVHAVKLLAERTADDLPEARAALADSDPFVRRAAADALGRHPQLQNVRPLLDAWAQAPADDTHLIHVVRVALRDQLQKPGLFVQLADVIAVDDRANLDRLANICLGVKSEESAAFVAGHVVAGALADQREVYLHYATRHVAADRLPGLYRAALEWQSLAPPKQLAVLRAVGQGSQERGETWPPEYTAWTNRLATTLLSDDDERRQRWGIELARDFRPKAFELLSKAAASGARHAGLRPAAMDACAGYPAAQAIPVLTAVLADNAEPLNLRQHAAGVLARVNDDAARMQLLASLQTAPEGLALAVAAALADSKPGANDLLEAVKAGKASARLLQESNVANRLRARKLDNFDERIKELTAGLPPHDQRINELIAKRREKLASTTADTERGVALFEKHCAQCHRIGDRGAKVGPNLDGVGIRGTERLLEDILDPNRAVDQAFRTTQIVSTNGQNIVGLALREEGEILVLADNQGKEIRVPRDEIEQRVVSQMSLMPANVPDLMNEDEFVHLIGYLMTQRVAPAK